MADNKKLYFIPILAKAFESEDRSTALIDAITEIIRLGKLPEYRKGFAQFEQFFKSGMDDVSREPGELTGLIEGLFEALIAEFATDMFDGPDELRQSLITAIKGDPKLTRRFEEIIEGSKEEGISFAVELYKDDKFLNKQTLSAESPRSFFEDIHPGRYTLKLSTGRIIWESIVEEEELLWRLAFPEKEYPMAAATENDKDRRTKSWKLLDGELFLFVCAGLESGSFELLIE